MPNASAFVPIGTQPKSMLESTPPEGPVVRTGAVGRTVVDGGTVLVEPAIPSFAWDHDRHASGSESQR